MFNWWLKDNVNDNFRLHDMRDKISPEYKLPENTQKAITVAAAVHCQDCLNEIKSGESKSDECFPTQCVYNIVNDLVTNFDFVQFLPRTSPASSLYYYDIAGNYVENGWAARVRCLKEAAETEMTDPQGTTERIKIEILHEIILDLKNQAGTVFKDKKITWDSIEQASRIIEDKTDYKPNWIITGPEVALSLGIDFVNHNTIFASRGAKTNGYNVVVDPLSLPNQLLLTTNQNNHEGYFWSFYFFSKTPMFTDPESFCGRRGHFMRYSKKLTRNGSKFTALIKGKKV